MSAPAERVTIEHDLPSSQLSAQNPYPGLSPFQEGDQAFFFGREHEKVELFRLIRRDVLTVLFGQSGLGKTSLLRAGVFPLLRENFFLPIPIRLSFAADAPALIAQVKRMVSDEIAAQQVDALQPKEDETLWEYFHKTRFWNAKNRLLTPVLVFDQFEETFTLGQDKPGLEPLRTELADLVENQIPEVVRTRLAHTGEALEFSYDTQDFRVLISLREDFLPPLEELRTRMPSIARNRMRLNQLSGAQALEAIFKPGRDLVSEEVAIEIIGFITGKTIPPSEGERNAALEQLQVEPALLNLICQELNERRQAQDLATISTDLLKGTKDRILADFYERCLKDLGPEVRQFIEEYLLTESGYRRAETIDDALRVAGVKEAAIITLVDRRVLRREERLGIPHIELIHDVLTPIVRERRELRRRKEAGRKRRRRLIIGIGIGIFAIISALVVSAIFAGLYLLAEEQRIRAEKSRQHAEELINFMLFDLKDSLQKLGRLDLLDTVASRSLKYFESLPEAELSEESIRNRGVALHNIGDVLKAKGDLIGAL